MRALLRIVRSLPLLIVSPFLLLAPLAALLFADVVSLFRRKLPPAWDTAPSLHGVSVVIPNWNGKHLLAKYLPSVIEALEGNPNNEIIVVDNYSSDDSAEFILSQYPGIRVVSLRRNRGFGGGSNAGFRRAKNDIVVLLNNDMRVEPNFVQPLLDGFRDDKKVFSVSCQIFFSDPNKLREETGLTQGWWQHGALRVRHRIDSQIQDLYPCFYGGGGSCAYDRRKFLSLGGFDSLLAPFYLEDTDLGYMAWKRGWKVLYQPRSIVYHEHRGTIGRRFTEKHIQAVLKKNFILFAWKNIHEWRRLFGHFAHTYFASLVSILLGDSPERSNLNAIGKAFRQLPGALRSRTRARRLAVVSDTEAFRRPLGGYFRDRFASLPLNPERLSVLFVSPYAVCPPTHGGGVFMYQAIRNLAPHCDLHLVILVDFESELAPHDELRPICASVELHVRDNSVRNPVGSMVPHAIHEFGTQDVEWILHRQIYHKAVDVVQLEYLSMGQYAAAFNRIPCILFEHDIYFQSIASALKQTKDPLRRLEARYEYLRALRYELNLLRKVDRIQVCSRENRDYLLSFLPSRADVVDDDLRAGIECSRYNFQPRGREPNTMLFLGSFRHQPNQEALMWFAREVWPLVRAGCPTARLIVIGSDPPPRYSLPERGAGIELLGFAEDVREALGRYAVFVCPILSGSGVRVKLLEAFAAGIPVASTRLGAEGLASIDGEICALADDPQAFAERILALFADPGKAAEIATRARQEVLRHRDMPVLAGKLLASYQRAIHAKRRDHATLTAPGLVEPSIHA